MHKDRAYPRNGPSSPLVPSVPIEAGSWPVWAQLLASLALAYHLSAVLISCLAAAPSSSVEQRAFEAVRPYCDVIYQGVSYRYYCRLDMTVDPANPRPWGTPIVVADMEFKGPGGTVRTEMLRLPDSVPIHPHLRHQRRIDLAFHLANDPKWAASYARHICKSRGCEGVSLYLQVHHVPGIGRLRASGDLTNAIPHDRIDGSTYGPRIKLGDFRCADFSQK